MLDKALTHRRKERSVRDYEVEMALSTLRTSASAAAHCSPSEIDSQVRALRQVIEEVNGIVMLPKEAERRAGLLRYAQEVLARRSRKERSS